MGVMPSGGRWPRRLPDSEQASFYLDNRNATTDKYDRTGPYLGTMIPSNGQLQVPSTNARGESIMVFVDARLWLPLESGAAARSIATNVLTNASYTIVYVQRWKDQIQCYALRRSPS